MRVVVLIEEAFEIFASNLVSAGKHVGIEMMPFVVPNDTVTQTLQNKFELFMANHQVDTVLIINDFKNGDTYFLKDSFLERYRCYLWFWDSMHRIELKRDRLIKYKKVSSFEIGDMSYAKSEFGIDINYVPLVAGESFCSHPVDSNQNRPIDISFIGLVPKNSYRLELLNRLALHCKGKGYNLKLYGHFWHCNNWYQRLIGKIKFRLRYPVLAEYVENRFIQPDEAVEIYKHTKINLNIHIKEHKSYNCRTFDVMGNNNFLLSSEQEKANLELLPEVHFVTYKTDDEFIKQIEHYMKYEDERNRIAMLGGEQVRSMYKLEYFINQVFE